MQLESFPNSLQQKGSNGTKYALMARLNIVGMNERILRNHT